MPNTLPTVGDLLRTWRGKRHLSQMVLALETGLSQRHLSFVESGRAAPSRETVLRLAETLNLPLRDRNVLLVTAGFAPLYPTTPLDAPAFSSVRAVIARIIEGHMPHPALAVDRHWNLVTANAAVQRLLAGVAPHLLRPPVNVLRLSLHPEGLAPRIVNLAAWRKHLLDRLAQEVALTADPALAALRDELAAYPVPATAPPSREAGTPVAMPLILATPHGRLSFLSTTTVFGTAADVTLSELTIEAFFPADAATAAAMTRLAEPA